MAQEYLRARNYEERYKSFNKLSNAQKYLEYSKQLKKPKNKHKKKQTKSSNSFVSNSYEQVRRNQSLSNTFKSLHQNSNKISQGCNNILKSVESIVKFVGIVVVSLFAVRSYLDSVNSTFNTAYTPDGGSTSGLSTGHMSKEGKEKLKNHEGLRLEAYDLEGKGVYTIGYGHYGTIDGKPIQKGQKITKEKAEELFEKDVTAKENLVKAQLKKAGITTPISQKQFDAMVNYAFMHALGPKFLAKLKAGDYIGASKELDFNRGMKNVNRMKYLQESFRADVTPDNKLNAAIINPVIKTTSAGKIRNFSNNTSVGGYKMYNPSAQRQYVSLSERAETYLRNTGGQGIVTSGAEGSHAFGALSHSSGNKIDVQGLKGANTSMIEYAQLCVNFLKNPETAYINLESFTINEINIVVNWIRQNAPNEYTIAMTKTKYSPGKCIWNQGYVLCSVNTGYAKHLDIGIKPDAYSKKENDLRKKQIEKEVKNADKLKANNEKIQTKNQPQNKTLQKPSTPKTTSQPSLNIKGNQKKPTQELKNTNIADPVTYKTQEKKAYKRERK